MVNQRHHFRVIGKFGVSDFILLMLFNKTKNKITTSMEYYYAK
jgi:hypothetical protein